MTWACIRVQSRRERRAVDFLQERQVTAYAPREVTKVVVRNPRRPGDERWAFRTGALMPTYVFVLVTCEADIDVINELRPKPLIMTDAFGRPRRVDLQRLGEIILMDAFGLFDDSVEATKPKTTGGYVPRWEKGDRVKGKGGNVEGWFGTVIGFKGGQQIEVMFEGQPRPAKVDDGNLIAAPELPPIALVAA